jgi:GNAT superfamily N-acetyltransferase
LSSPPRTLFEPAWHGRKTPAKSGALSRSAFADHVGHYHADPRLSPTATAEGYGEWAERLCRTSDEDQPCFLAHDASGLVGFAALRTSRSDQVDCELCAVAGKARRHGVFRALMAASGGWAAARRYAKLTYPTQIQNNVALRAVTSLGFRYERACYTFHKWFEPDT